MVLDPAGNNVGHVTAGSIVVYEIGVVWMKTTG